MKNLLFLPLLFLTAYLPAFDIYGLKSGMTKTEFYEMTNCQAFVDNYNLKKSSYSDTRDLTYCLDVPKLWGSDHESYGHESMPYFDGIEPSIDLEWTHDDKLWRVQITDTVPKGILKSIAFKQAFTEAFPGIEIQESSSTSQYGTTNRLTVVYIDSTVFDQSVSFYKNEYLNALKNKQ